jgi:CBS domain containing-hemolysin-like protein
MHLSHQIYLEIEKKQDNFLSKILTKLTEKPSKFIAAMLIGNNIALVVYGFYGVFTDESDRFVRYHFSDLLNLLIQTVLST